MTLFHSDESREENYLPDMEVFYHDGTYDEWDCFSPEYNDGEALEPGWYYWACFPGCMPEGDPIGPFASEKEAIDDARDS
ncbi:MAG: hypothetical protein M0R06_18065 [Sphaerochaeta sp.]|jgi:hypothetical protein|nr:hypothetical protein [Sphaerochaeta sp.]